MPINTSDVYPDKLDIKYASIAASASLSGAVPLGAGTPIVIEMPTAWDAANLTFQTSSNGTTFQDYYDSSGNEFTVVASASRNIKIEPSDFAGARHIKIRSGTASVPVNQSAIRSINIGLRVL